MLETSVSLLERLRANPHDPAWQRFDELYRPLILHWLRQVDSTPDHDADDLTQEIMTTIFLGLPSFERQRSGSFRCWVRTITVHRLKAYWRGRRKRPVPVGGRPWTSGWPNWKIRPAN
jgi:RNA polymerase sigma-70 factor (ECF subfamily)